MAATTIGKLSDLALVTQVALMHNNHAFDQLVRKYQSSVRRFFLSQSLGDSQLSDDLAQDTFIKAYTAITQFRGSAAFSTWLMRIAYNVWHDHLRRRHWQVGCLDADLPAADPSGTVAAAPLAVASAAPSMLGEDINNALALLKEAERQCISLQLVEGYSLDEIASITQMPVGTVKSHLSRGKTKLANYLRENGYDG